MMSCWLLTVLYFINYVGSAADSSSPRHIVYVLSDDIGYSDIYSMNGQFPTPFIDSLMEESIILNRHYVHYVCSISRTQFLTGRSVMNQGFGKSNVWSYTSIGGIPIGQPTIANWLRDFNGDNIRKYKTYGIGKWHIGYSSYLQTPEYKGFDHFYGFYQGGIDYDTKTHSKADYWLNSETGKPYDELQYDFFEDEEIAFDALKDTTNTMYLYENKIHEYLDDFVNNADEENMYLYLGVQTLHAHGDFPRIPDKTAKCLHILADSNPSDMRIRYCEYTLLTDDWMKYLVDELKSYNLWDDTLLIFTSDNGADINKEGTGCNYPLRGSKGTYFDGNIRDITFISGGKNIIPSTKYGEIRESLISNLDWTPTLLSYAGILKYIDNDDYKWDGVDVWDVIINGDDSKNKRDNILLNVQGPDIINFDNIPSMKILFINPNDNHLYKYILADTDSKFKYDNKWVSKTGDGWCLVNFDKNRDIYIELRDDSKYSHSSSIKHNQFLFDLTEDESEKYNLIRKERINGNKLTEDEISDITNYAKNEIKNELNNKYINYYHSPLQCLYEHDALGDPGLFLEEQPIRGLYVKPFLDRNQYLNKIVDCFNEINDDENQEAIPEGLKDMYLNDWIPPNPITTTTDDENEYNVWLKPEILNNQINQLIIGIITIFIIFSLLCLYKIKSKNKEYSPIN